ncbi:ABC-2 type transporter-domain-containing protein [Hyaloraphidium curvatum]|nr:ABC-2 type transporter-domain-containing protein [Hyaloraphidium curvatum]
MAPVEIGRRLARGSKVAPEADKTVLADASGFVRGGEMLLVLGKPDSGASALVRTLGQQGRYFKSVEGRMAVNGIPADDFMKAFGSELYYSGDEDRHLPSLTVSQTLDYALRYRERDPARRAEWLEWLVTWLGLTKAKDTIVGDAFLRGVSGGERRRVSVGEQLAANATINFYDQCTKGLDSTYALVVIKGLRLVTSALNKTTVVYLNQVSDAIYDLFDRVLVLHEGRVIYQGTPDKAKEYFTKLGFDALPRQSVPDFITQCIEPKEQNPRAGVRNAPRTPADFESAWLSSPEHAAFAASMAAVKAELEAAGAAASFGEAVVRRREASSSAGAGSVLPTTGWEQFATTVKREFTLLSGQKFMVVAKWFFNLAVSLIVSSFAFQAPDTGAGSFAKSSGLFFALLINALNTNADIPDVVNARPVMYKQKNNFFFRPAYYYLATIAADLPMRLLYVGTFAIVFYWMVGYKATAPAFLIFVLVQYCAGVAYSAQSRFLVALSKDQDTAFRTAGALLIPTILYSGWALPYQNMRPWFIWLYWINPLAYAYKAVMINEFADAAISCEGNLFPPYPGVSVDYQSCTVPGAQPGSDVVSGADWLWATYRITDNTAYIWYNFAAIIGLTIIYTVLATVVTSFVEFGKGGVVTNIYKKGFAPRAAAAGTATTSEFDDADKAKDAVVVELSGSNPLSLDTLDGTSDPNRLNPTAHKKSTADIARTKAFDAPTITFRDLSYHVAISRGTERQLLDSISGRVVPGRLLALMGFTGAGKTTLQDVLARRKTDGRIEGTVLVDDRAQDDSFKRIAAYAEQSDVLNPNFTVREALRFSAYTRQPADVPKAEKDSYVEEIIGILGMDGVAEALVGSLELGVGIGLVDRKKLNIGIQLVAKPKVLILDEPTSGQDSYAAFQIVRLLRSLADLGLAIFCTIHQPSALLFEYFDDLMLIGNGGKAVYYGEIGPEGKTVTDYFARNGALPIAPGENPAEYVLDAGNGLRDAKPARTAKWPEIWLASPEYAELRNVIDHAVEHQNLDAPSGDSSRAFALSTAQQIPLVAERTLLDYYRDGPYNFGRIALAILQAVIVGFTYWQLPDTSSGAVVQMLALFTIATLGIPFVILPLNPFDARRKYFLRDQASGMYNWFAWCLGITVAEIPFTVIAPTIFFPIIYFTYGLQFGHLAPLIFWAGLIVYHMWANSFSQSIAAFTPNAGLATLLVSLTTTIMPASSGVPVPYSVLVPFWRFFYWVNPQHWASEIFVTNQLHDLNLSCSAAEATIFNPPAPATCAQYMAPAFANGAPGLLLNPSATSGCEYCPITNGDTFLEFQLGWSFSNIGRAFGVLLALYVFDRIMMNFFMWWRTGRSLTVRKRKTA